MEVFSTSLFTMSERLFTFSSFLTYCLLIWQTLFIVIKTKGISNSDYTSDNLKNNETYSILLTRGVSKSFYTVKATNSLSLTFIVVPCSADVSWSIYKLIAEMPQNDVLRVRSMGGSMVHLIHDEAGSDGMTYYQVTKGGFYSLTLMAPKADTYVFIRTVEEGTRDHSGARALRPPSHLQPHLPLPLPHMLRYAKRFKIHIEHHKNRTLAFHWSPSVLNPKSTTFCVVINTRQHYRSLCAAKKDRDGFSAQNCAFTDQFPVRKELIDCPEPIDLKLRNIMTHNDDDRIFNIGCIYGTNSYTVGGFSVGTHYFVDVFAKSTGTYNLSTHFGSTQFVHQEPSRSLRDGKATTVNLNKLPEAIFKFRTGREASGSLEFIVMPCGGTVEAQLTLHGQIIEKTQIRNKHWFVVPQVEPLQRYKLIVSNFQHFDITQHSSNVQVLATMNKTVLSLIPELPSPSIIYEFKGLRSCRSVTIGWVPVQKAPKPIWYCVYAFEKDHSSDFNPIPDQCKLESRMKYLNSLAVTPLCLQSSTKTESNNSISSGVITQKIAHLKPNSSYIIQVVVKIHGGRSLSYDRLSVQTKRSCKKLK